MKVQFQTKEDKQDEIQIKKEWICPEIFEMNVNQTAFNGYTNDDGDFAPSLS
jgi:hypothetical protein